MRTVLSSSLGESKFGTTPGGGAIEPSIWDMSAMLVRIAYRLSRPGYGLTFIISSAAGIIRNERNDRREGLSKAEE